MLKATPYLRGQYNRGFDYGMLCRTNKKILEDNEPKMMAWIKDEEHLGGKAYWQGYYDAVQGWMRNSGPLGSFMNAPMPGLTMA